MITAPDGWPLWTSQVRPGREHDTTCARAHPELLPALDAWIDSDHAALGDLGYEGENQRLTCQNVDGYWERLNPSGTART